MDTHMDDRPFDTEKKIDEEEKIKKIPWEDPEVIILDINDTQGGSEALFEDDSGIAS
jgi:hypothetical protein